MLVDDLLVGLRKLVPRNFLSDSGPDLPPHALGSFLNHRQNQLRTVLDELLLFGTEAISIKSSQQAMDRLLECHVDTFLPDGDGETVPSNVEGVPYPIHVLQITAMGMTCSDSLQFEDLARVCEKEKRWEFMVSIAPLRLPRGTGSLFNPIAIF